MDPILLLCCCVTVIVACQFIPEDDAVERPVPVLSCTHGVGRVIPSPIVREMLRALGVETCPRCNQVTAIYGRRR